MMDKLNILKIGTSQFEIADAEARENVDNIKSAFVTGILPPFTIIENEYVEKSNGAITNYNGWSRTDYIPVDKIPHFSAKTSPGSAYNVFYDSNKNFISAFIITTEEQRFITPTNASYVIFSNSNAGMDALEVKPIEISEVTEKAGFTPIDMILTPIIGVTGTFTSGGMSWSQDEDTHILTVQDNTTASGQTMGRIAWDIKPLFGKGIVLKFKITNRNGNGRSYIFASWYLSKSSVSWGPNAIKFINISDLGGSGYAFESEFELDIDDYFSNIDPSDYTNTYLLVAAFLNNPTSMGENVLSIEVKAISPKNYVIANELKGFKQSDYYTKTEVDDLIDTGVSDVDLLCWGDSLTAGAGGGGTNYPNVCASELGLTVRNCGVGGENANTIAARQGGNALIIPAGDINGTYAYTDFKGIFGGNVRPLRQGTGSNSGNKIYIDGEECTLAITQSSATSTDATYTISGYTGGASTVPKLARFAGSDFKGKIVVIWVGTNGSYVEGVSSTIDSRIAVIDSMIKHLNHNRYVVMGISRGDSSTYDADDTAMLAHYGNKFFPTRKLLVEYGLTINGLTPTTQDETDIANGTVPTQLRAPDDTVHMNAYGYTAIGKLLADKIRSLGYVD